MSPIQHYLDKISQRHQSGKATEHSYRGDLQNLLESLLPNISITNEPVHIKCGAPDYILSRNELDIGWIEAKDIGKPLNSKEYKEQFDRYRAALDNLIITDYLQFDFYRSGEKVVSIKLAQLENKIICALPDNFAQFINLIKDFANYTGQNITSASQLSKIMAAKARLLANIIENALNSDEQNQENSSLQDQLLAFKSVLLHEIKPSEFADIYAQTIAYGMFAARLHDDDDPQSFSRQKAAEKIPLSNPFLRKLFQYIAGFDLDNRIVWIVNALADIFRAVNTVKIMQNFGSSSQQNDPIIHFYETFLAEYDPKLRKSRGVWYTPQPVVNFIIRAVDDLLKSEFQLPLGLADTTKTMIKVDTPVLKGKGKTNYTVIEKLDKEIHKVQILDPATGTGTFLAETVKHIYANEFQTVQGKWSAYVEDDLIPRLNGFEILMASYAMAHLKLDLLLTETGYIPKKQPRFNIYLTNSLEEHHPDTHSLFATWLSQEANAANHIKRDTPVMVVMGNPPYSVSSSNKGDWIRGLLNDYKKDLNEKNIQPLSDDYIKFIRYGSHFIEKNGAGILAYISNNSFIDGVIHRQMRKHLLETFDSIYILDLHGSNKKQETAPDGSKDENVFDIMQGVSINIFVKNGCTNQGLDSKLATVYHKDLYGLREDKYETLLNNSLKSLVWNKIACRAPEYFFIAKDIAIQIDYEQGFSINELFSVNSSGIKTHRDDFVIDFNANDLKLRIERFYNLDYSDVEIKNKLGLKDNRDWSLSKARQSGFFELTNIKDILYRPFDYRKIYYDSNLIDFGREKVMQHFFKEDNLCLISCRQQSTFNFQHIFVSYLISDMCSISSQTKETGYAFPLYTYPEPTTQQNLEETSTREPNLNPELIKQIAAKLGLEFVAEKNLRGLKDLAGLAAEENNNTFAPIDLLDYIYAVLHSPHYRETYKEFLKIDFPRVPYPELKTFWQLVELGGELRKLHLLESKAVHIINYPIDGSDCITRKLNKNDFVITDVDNNIGQVWINDHQYFANVPLIAWTFYIGGYQPAQKWLKDRHGRVLSLNDIKHYTSIINALVETDRIMKAIDL
jgi:predicted helicase